MSRIINSKISKVKIAATMLMIITLSILFAIQSQPIQPAQPVKVVAPDLIIMRRESDPSRSILVNLPNGNTLVWEV